MKIITDAIVADFLITGASHTGRAFLGLSLNGWHKTSAQEPFLTQVAPWVSW